jgi:hypothetical protein
MFLFNKLWLILTKTSALIDLLSHITLVSLDQMIKREDAIFHLQKKRIHYRKKIFTITYIQCTWGKQRSTFFQLLWSLNTPFASSTLIKFLIHARRFRLEITITVINNIRMKELRTWLEKAIYFIILRFSLFSCNYWTLKYCNSFCKEWVSLEVSSVDT